MNFLDKIDLAIFKNLNENHEPVTYKAIKFLFFGGLLTTLLIFILQLSDIQKSTEEALTLILLACLIVSMYIYVWKTLKAFPAWWKAVIYGIYLLVLSVATFYIAMWAFIIALAGLLIYVIFMIFFAPEKSKKKYKIRYSDGTEKDAELDGRGICGEKYIKDEDGNTHIIN